MCFRLDSVIVGIMNINARILYSIRPPCECRRGVVPRQLWIAGCRETLDQIVIRIKTKQNLGKFQCGVVQRCKTRQQDVGLLKDSAMVQHVRKRVD